MNRPKTVAVRVTSPGAELRVLRAAAGLRVMDVAARCNIHPNTLALLEKDKRPLPEAMAGRIKAAIKDVSHHGR